MRRCAGSSPRTLGQRSKRRLEDFDRLRRRNFTPSRRRALEITLNQKAEANFARPGQSISVQSALAPSKCSDLSALVGSAEPASDSWFFPRHVVASARPRESRASLAKIRSERRKPRAGLPCMLHATPAFCLPGWTKLGARGLARIIGFASQKSAPVSPQRRGHAPSCSRRCHRLVLRLRF